MKFFKNAIYFRCSKFISVGELSKFNSFSFKMMDPSACSLEASDTCICASYIVIPHIPDSAVVVTPENYLHFYKIA